MLRGYFVQKLVFITIISSVFLNLPVDQDFFLLRSNEYSFTLYSYEAHRFMYNCCRSNKCCYLLSLTMVGHLGRACSFFPSFVLCHSLDARVSSCALCRYRVHTTLERNDNICSFQVTVQGVGPCRPSVRLHFAWLPCLQHAFPAVLGRKTLVTMGRAWLRRITRVASTRRVRAKLNEEPVWQ